MSGTDPASPPFVPIVADDLEDELAAPYVPFALRFSSQPVPFNTGSTSTPMTRSATPKRPRTTTSPPPPPVPTTDWALEYKKYRAEAQGIDHPTTQAVKSRATNNEDSR